MVKKILISLKDRYNRKQKINVTEEDIEKLPVIPKLPVIKADPVYGNADPLPPPLPVGTVIGKVELSPFVNVIVLEEIDAVIIAFGA